MEAAEPRREAFDAFNQYQAGMVILGGEGKQGQSCRATLVSSHPQSQSLPVSNDRTDIFQP